ATISLVTGAVFMMWLGEQITERGIGNGISILIFAGIVAGFPIAVGQMFQSARDGDTHILLALAIAVLAIASVWIVVRIERGSDASRSTTPSASKAARPLRPRAATYR